MEDPEIKYLFEPRGIAVIGASHDQSKIGYKILDNIVSGGYHGQGLSCKPQRRDPPRAPGVQRYQ